MRITVFTCIFITSLMPAMAGNTYLGGGGVNMQGAIIDTACAIATESRDQSIDMEVVPLADMMIEGQGQRKPFSIELVNCELERHQDKKMRWKQFQVTFDGDAEGEFFNVRGEASGIALQITDELGNVASPGLPLPQENISSENLLLNYNIRLVANQYALKAGNYFSSIRIKFDYF